MRLLRFTPTGYFLRPSSIFSMPPRPTSSLYETSLAVSIHEIRARVATVPSCIRVYSIVLRVAVPGLFLTLLLVHLMPRSTVFCSRPILISLRRMEPS